MAVDLIRIAGDMELRFLYADTGKGTSFSRKFGAKSVPALDLSVNFGAGANQCNCLYFEQGRSLAATTYDNFDLYGGLTDAFGTTINAASLKLAIVAIDTPDGTARLQVGPQSQTNAAQLGWGGTGATAYQTVYDWWKVSNMSAAGWAITAGTADVFPVYNPTAGSISYSILLAGD